ncbi:MAG TPA: hypothetical protein DEQ17_07860 [Prevotella sp.]|nr:hypothetical protein [Prevotella sp.]
MTTDYRKLPSRVLYALSGVIVLVFALFWLVGFDRPYEDDGNFNAPLFTDVLLVFMLLLTAGAIGVAAWSAVRSGKVNGGGARVVNNIPVRKIGLAVATGTAIMLVLTFLFASSDTMKINGLNYTDTFWLKASGMFVSTTLVMIFVAIAAIVYGATRYIRKS